MKPFATPDPTPRAAANRARAPLPEIRFPDAALSQALRRPRPAPARAHRHPGRRRLRLVRPPGHAFSAGRSAAGHRRTRAPRLGCRPLAQEPDLDHLRTLFLGAQSALHWNADRGRRMSHRRRPTAPGRGDPGGLSADLHPRRRAGRAASPHALPRLCRLRPACAAVPSSPAPPPPRPALLLRASTSTTRSTRPCSASSGPTRSSSSRRSYEKPAPLLVVAPAGFAEVVLSPANAGSRTNFARSR